MTNPNLSHCCTMCVHLMGSYHLNDDGLFSSQCHLYEPVFSLWYQCHCIVLTSEYFGGLKCTSHKENTESHK